MRTVLLPLDERPCNAYFPQLLAKTNQKIELVTPAKDILGDKKTPARYEDIAAFLETESARCDNMVLSLDMLLYGGLLPSRIHHINVEALAKRLAVLKHIKKEHPALKIYAFQCIMRCPQYDSSEEEPDYYQQYGYALFKSAYLKDKQERDGLNEEEKHELAKIHVPPEIREDYERRRQINSDMNMRTLDLLADQVIDFLVIPQDDSSPYGYTAIDQQKVHQAISQKHLEFKTMVYPGADEVSMSLLARAYNEYYHLKPVIYPFYASVLGPTIIPLYEDRPMFESLKSHIQVTGALLAESPDQSTHILAINSPGKLMQESFASVKDITYTSYRNLPSFVERIQRFINAGYRVGISDSAYANGGDRQLIYYLDHLNLLERLYAYAGWNTNCNTLGTTLSLLEISEHPDVQNTIYRIIEDAFYQSKVRTDVIDHDLKELHLGYYDFKDQQAEVEKRISDKLLQCYDELVLSKKYPLQSLTITMPWKRMFEIGMRLEFKK